MWYFPTMFWGCADDMDFLEPDSKAGGKYWAVSLDSDMKPAKIITIPLAIFWVDLSLDAELKAPASHHQ
jgi:hypothetical protein